MDEYFKKETLSEYFIVLFSNLKWNLARIDSVFGFCFVYELNDWIDPETYFECWPGQLVYRSF